MSSIHPSSHQAAVFSVQKFALPNTQPCIWLCFDHGVLTLEGLQQAHAALTQYVREPVLGLYSKAITLPRKFGNDTERLAWMQMAGVYRRQQTQYQQQGGQLVSWVSQTLTGGSYLLHGLAASTRWASADTLVYPALPSEAYTALTQQPYPYPVDVFEAIKQDLLHAVWP